MRVAVLEEWVRGRRGLRVGVGVFWGGGCLGTAAEEFAAFADGLLGDWLSMGGVCVCAEREGRELTRSSASFFRRSNCSR